MPQLRDREDIFPFPVRTKHPPSKTSRLFLGPSQPPIKLVLESISGVKAASA